MEQNMKQRQVIRQTEAALLRGCSRQAVNELIKKKRFTTPVVNGMQLPSYIYLDEVHCPKVGRRGRPPLSDAERENRLLDDFYIGDEVMWTYKVTGGFGYKLAIPATVKKVGVLQLQLEFKDASGQAQTRWATRGECKILNSE